MTLVNIVLKNVAGEYGPDDCVVFHAPQHREGIGGQTINTAPKTVALVEGVGSVDLDPGPVTVTLRTKGWEDTAPKTVNVPETGPVTLTGLLLDAFEWSPVIVSQVSTLADRAESSANRAENIASQFDSLEGVVVEARAAKDAAKSAAGSATAAAQSAVNAAASETAAKQSESSAGDYAEVATAAAAEAVDAMDEAARLADDFSISNSSVIRDHLAALNEAFEASEAGQALPPYLTQESLNRSYGYYVTDEQTLDYAIANFNVINLKPGVRFLVGGRKNIPENTVFNTNGATIDIGGYSDFVFEFKSGCRINGTLNLVTEGTDKSRGVLLNGDNITADDINVESTVPAAGSASGYATGVTIAGSNISVGTVRVKNFEFAVNVFSYIDNVSSKNISIQRLVVENFQRGLWVRDVDGLTITAGTISGKSTSADFLPGHNGVLVESRFDGASSNLRFTLSVNDSGEHGFRLGGQFPIRNVWFTNCSARNVGGCGFKALGGIDAAARHYNINYNNCIVEDAGQTSQNQSGFLIERVSGGTVSNAVVRKSTKQYSCYTGIRVNNCQDVTILNPNVDRPAAHGIDITGYSGSCERVTLNGGIVRGPGNCGINIDFYGRKFRRVLVSGRPVLEVFSASAAVRVGNTGGSGEAHALGAAYIEFAANGSSPVVEDGTKSFIFDIFSDTFTDTDLVNGSVWRTRNDGVIRRKAANVWGVL